MRYGKSIGKLYYGIALAAIFLYNVIFPDVNSSNNKFIMHSFFVLFVYQMLSMSSSMLRRSNRQYIQFPIKSSQIMIANWISFYSSVIMHILIIFFLSLFGMHFGLTDLVSTLGIGLTYIILMIVLMTNGFAFEWKNGNKRWECYLIFVLPIAALIYLNSAITSYYGDAYIIGETYPTSLIFPLIVMCLLLSAGNVWLFNRKDDYLDEKYKVFAKK